MRSVTGKYMALIRAFLDGSLTAAEFESRYLATFKGEQARLRAPVFDVLQQLFSDVDAYSPDCSPGQESAFVISEARLREQAAAALRRLEQQQAAPVS